jgi:hypothetical protein
MADDSECDEDYSLRKITGWFRLRADIADQLPPRKVWLQSAMLPEDGLRAARSFQPSQVG